jgi:hypothetical protein
MVDDNQEVLRAQAHRSRRNFLAIGGLATSALLATVATARSRPDEEGHNCFLKGTRILTAEGKRKVEDLAIGDELPTVFGGTRPIQWIGRYRFKKSDPQKSWARDAQPVRIARSALAPNVPEADLYVTPAHKLLIDGALVPAGDLINEMTITRHAADELSELEFFHIKLEAHDAIYAEGATCETLCGVDENASNFAEYLRLYGTAKVEEPLCAPVLAYNGGRGKLRSRIRSAVSPWFDRRQKFDVIRDRLEERAIALGAYVQASS